MHLIRILSEPDPVFKEGRIRPSRKMPPAWKLVDYNIVTPSGENSVVSACNHFRFFLRGDDGGRMEHGVMQTLTNVRPWFRRTFTLIEEGIFPHFSKIYIPSSGKLDLICLCSLAIDEPNSTFSLLRLYILLIFSSTPQQPEVLNVTPDLAKRLVIKFFFLDCYMSKKSWPVLYIMV